MTLPRKTPPVQPPPEGPVRFPACALALYPPASPPLGGGGFADELLAAIAEADAPARPRRLLDGTGSAADFIGPRNPDPQGLVHGEPTGGLVHGEPTGGLVHGEPTGGLVHGEPTGGLVHGEPTGGLVHGEPTGGLVHGEPTGGLVHGEPTGGLVHGEPTGEGGGR